MNEMGTGCFHETLSVNIVGMFVSCGHFAEFEANVSKSGTMRYIHPDHLGSYHLVTDAVRNRVDSLHFDPWGNRKKHDDWSQKDNRSAFLFTRGFTGHEHLDPFKIINMNGRLYDPVIGRFFSPDPFVQLPDFTQNFNRYSYCLNNPLMYTDPSGYGFISNCLVKVLDVIAIPARILTEGVSWLEDKINGWERDGGYFNGDYLMGKAAPYNVPFNPCDQLASPYNAGPLNQEFYEPTGPDRMDDIDGARYRSMKSTIKVPGLSYRVEGGERRSYKKSLEIVQWHLVKMDAEVGQTVHSSFLSPDASAGIGYGTAWASGFASTASVGMAEFATASKILKIPGNAAGIAGGVVTGIEIGDKFFNRRENTSDWLNLVLTATITGVGVFATAPAWIVGSAVIGFGYGIYRAAGGQAADEWINSKFGYR